MALSRAVVMALCLVASLNRFVVMATDDVETANNLRGSGDAVAASAMVEEAQSVQSVAAADVEGSVDEDDVDAEDGDEVAPVDSGPEGAAPLPGDEDGGAPWSHVGGFR
eukprot:TRINITY_DN18573_c0_g2_i1.p2 TRINITY_DN18573_c0_g2~~TRINITY_DN18573_c0_g2_i1.p2  ORF type:complete len:109 (-),score=29.87 TRINITY_DN18573_c0_g2_i1:181-507(-)